MTRLREKMTRRVVMRRVMNCDVRTNVNGQIAIEFILMISMAFLLGVLYLATSSELVFRFSEDQRLAVLNDVGYTVQDELILATTVEDGYSRNFTLPEKADRFPYTITNDATSITLVSGTLTITYDIPTITGAFVKGSNRIVKTNTGLGVNS